MPVRSVRRSQATMSSAPLPRRPRVAVSAVGAVFSITRSPPPADAVTSTTRAVGDRRDGAAHPADTAGIGRRRRAVGRCRLGRTAGADG
jgi:hypothetical protein